mmetsp:Transcript_4914/g.18406  ORF Transcript_4914/g.18406 Transcript_4914/m.18406 type:complete len:221 (-) Transcript_4914:215-877(-)
MAHIGVPGLSEDGRALLKAVQARGDQLRRRASADHGARVRQRSQRRVRRRPDLEPARGVPVPGAAQQRVPGVGDVLPDLTLQGDARGARAHPTVLQILHRESRRVPLLLAGPDLAVHGQDAVDQGVAAGDKDGLRRRGGCDRHAGVSHLRRDVLRRHRALVRVSAFGVLRSANPEGAKDDRQHRRHVRPAGRVPRRRQLRREQPGTAVAPVDVVRRFVHG